MSLAMANQNLKFAGLVAAAFGIGAFAVGYAPKAIKAWMSCNIKGNVSYNSGMKIYHMPGQEDFASTVITPSRGERWFCSEDEARAAGWRRASR
ncbi:sunset domain-containing protein [Nitrobacter hamburgensis]|uniref:sunset domain-containing protein n=1 Tax=Nitrobacter hamburgensis TaxID=912 RepID=UPI00005556E4|nr:hypothetical protein [Nitrobacter hamburgensis]